MLDNIKFQYAYRLERLNMVDNINFQCTYCLARLTLVDDIRFSKHLLSGET